MGRELCIWTPVIVARLKERQHIREEKVYDIEKVYKSVEDLKIKIKDLQVNLQGQALETNIRVDVLCLVEDLLGTMHLVSREETLRHRISLLEFDNVLDRDKDFNYIVDVCKVEGQGEIDGKQLRIGYFIDYIIMAVREQAVNLVEGEQGNTENNHQSLEDIMYKLREEVVKVSMEREELRRKLFLYERNIASLKKGIRKAENRSARLDKEVGYYQQLVEQLREALQDKEMHLNKLRSTYYTGHDEPVIEAKDGEASLGSRIKRMFLNN